MRDALLLSLRMHFSWMTEAFSSRGRALGPLGLKRLSILFIAFPFYLLLQAAHWTGFFLDEIFFRSYRKVKIREPLFITGIPASGTRFIHETVARDGDQFTSLNKWEVLFAPSVCQRRMVRGIVRLDRLFGAPLRRILNFLLTRVIGPSAALNGKGLCAPAPDSLCLIPAGGCFMMMIAFPASPSLWQLGRFQETPDEQRKTLVHFYKSCLQKHLYAMGGEKRLLSRNPSCSSWIPDLRFAFPDARYLICVREPRAALASNLKALRPGLVFCGTLAAADQVSLEFQTALAHSYRILLEEKGSFLIDHMAVVDHASLEANSAAAMEKTLRQLTVPLTPALRQSIAKANPETGLHTTREIDPPLAAKSGPMEFGSMVGSIYRELLERRHLSAI